jgi:histidinol-phosphate aminotransferase
LTVSQLPCQAKLDQNESPLDLPRELKASLLDELAAADWNRYPQPTEYRTAKVGMAQALGLDPDTLSLTAGCDQAIQGAHFLAGGPGRRALVFEPTYPMLAHAGLMAGTEVERIALGPAYRIRPEHLTSGDHHLILIASPNNPTGELLAPDLLELALARSAMVFIDEAYYDLSGVTVAHLVPERPNLMIGRSCSKSLLAGMRLGFTISHPEVALRLDQLLTAPYHLGHAQLILARRFAELRPHVETSARAVIAERQRLESALSRLDLEVYPSRGNFLLIKLDRAAEVYQGLALAGIRIRYAPLIPGLEGHLRLTVGTTEQNDALLTRLEELTRTIPTSS